MQEYQHLGLAFGGTDFQKQRKGDDFLKVAGV